MSRLPPMPRRSRGSRPSSRWLRHRSLADSAHVAAPQRTSRVPSPTGPASAGRPPRGVADGQGLPDRPGTASTGRNIRWKVPIPGLAHSSPIVWGDRIYRDDRDQQPRRRDLQARPLRGRHCLRGPHVAAVGRDGARPPAPARRSGSRRRTKACRARSGTSRRPTPTPRRSPTAATSSPSSDRRGSTRST